MDQPEKVIYFSIADLASISNVSDPTVIRLCKKLGLKGYQDLKLTLAKEILNPIYSDVENDFDASDTTAIVDKIFAITLNSLTLTHDNLSIPDMDRATDILAKARKIIIIGTGSSHALCMDMQVKLLRMNFTVSAYSDPHLATIAIYGCGPEDVLLCVCHSGATKQIITLARQACSNHMKIVSISKVGITPLSKISNVTLHTTYPMPLYRALTRETRIPELAIIDCLYPLLAVRTGRTDFVPVDTALNDLQY